MLGLEPARLVETVRAFNAACPDGTATADYGDLDARATSGVVPPKSNWALPIDQPPFYAYPLRPGITFTYLGVAVNSAAQVCAQNGPFDNVFAAGEVMAGNILTRGYLAGFGLTIGSVFGRIAGRGAAAC
jgi:tricarballylate dehydrogenase